MSGDWTHQAHATMPAVAERLRQAYPAPLGAGGVGSIPANSDAQNVPSFRRWRFEMKLSPFFFIYYSTILNTIEKNGTIR